MRTDLFFYPAIAAAVLSSCGGKKDAAEVNKKPNVLFIYADDIGYGDLSCYGGKSIITPTVVHLQVHHQDMECSLVSIRGERKVPG